MTQREVMRVGGPDNPTPTPAGGLELTDAEIEALKYALLYLLVSDPIKAIELNAAPLRQKLIAHRKTL